MRVITTTIVIVGLLATGAPARAQNASEYTETFSKIIKIGSNGALDLSNFSGDVVIRGGGGDEARIQAVKRVRDRSEAAARELLRQLSIQVTERSGGVQVRTDIPNRRGLAAAVDYTVAVPEGATVTVKTVSGNLRVSNVKGDLRTESISGDVNLASIARLRGFSAVSGDVELRDVRGDDVVANLVNGDFTARNLKARSFELQTVSGDIHLNDADCERVTLKTVSGEIDYTGPLMRNGRYELQSHSGDVRLTPTSGGFDLDANTFSGDLHSDFALTAPPGAVAGRRSRRAQSLRGTTGDAGALVTIRTFSGDVVIVKR